MSDLTLVGYCKENGCGTGPDAPGGGRPNNVIICPITSTRDTVYVTMGGGGMLLADIKSTPTQARGEYGNQEINGAGCGGVEAGAQMFMNAGVSASGARATWSTFSIWSLDDAQPAAGGNAPDTPMPRI